MIITVVLLGLAAACSLFKQEIEVQQKFELRIDQPVEGALQFSVQKDVDTNTAEVRRYANDMDSFVIRKLTYKVKDFVGSEEPFVSGTIEFAPTGSSEFTVLSAITGLHLKEMAEHDQESTIILPESAVEEKLTQLLKQGAPVTFRLNAIANNSPLAATLLVSIDALMTVDM
ncbi:hypothetical protein [Pontibacter brevis]